MKNRFSIPLITGVVLCIGISSCGDSTSPARSANGLWIYDMAVASGDTSCTIADGFLALDDTSGGSDPWGLLDAVLDCAFPESERLNGRNPYGFYVWGVATESALDLSASIPDLTLQHSGVYRGNEMSGTLVGDVQDVISGSQAHMEGQWTARRDTESEELLVALQGSWIATDYRLGSDSTNLIAAGWTYELTFARRHVQTRVTDPDGLLSANGTDFALQDDVIWYTSRTRPANAFRVSFTGSDRLALVRDSLIWWPGTPTVRLSMNRSSD